MKKVGPLPRRRGSALARGCGRGGRVVLPLARAAVISTGWRVQLRVGAAHALDVLQDARVLRLGDMQSGG